MRASIRLHIHLPIGLLLSYSTGLLAQVDPQASLTDRPIIEMRIARLDPAPGYQFMAFAFPAFLPAVVQQGPYRSGLFVHLDILLSEKDFAVIQDISAGPRSLQLVVRLTQQAAARMRQQMRLGEYLATLVDSRLVSAAPLGAYLSDQAPLFITLHMPGPTADSTAIRLRARSPR